MGSKRNSNFSPTALKRSQMSDKQAAYSEKGKKFGSTAINWQSLSDPVISGKVMGPDGIERVIMRQFGRGAEPIAHGAKTIQIKKTGPKKMQVPVMIQEPVLDERGKVTLDKFGRVVTRDTDRPKLDMNGNPIMQWVNEPNKATKTDALDKKPIYEKIGVQSTMFVDPETGALVEGIDREDPETGEVKHISADPPSVIRFTRSNIPKSFRTKTMDWEGKEGYADDDTNLQYLMEDWANKVKGVTKHVSPEEMPLTSDRVFYIKAPEDADSGYYRDKVLYDRKHRDAGETIDKSNWQSVKDKDKSFKPKPNFREADEKAKEEANKSSQAGLNPAHGQLNKGPKRVFHLSDFKGSGDESVKAVKVRRPNGKKMTVIVHKKEKEKGNELDPNLEEGNLTISDARFKDISGHYNNLANHYNKMQTTSSIINAMSRKY